jgi:peptidoglycan/xylan/chitin deacetylase (PgdA/CDA1 family)
MPTIYLTFDDGPIANQTPQILDILLENEAQATFFDVGQFVSYNPELVKREVEEGHSVQNHSYAHEDLTTLTDCEARLSLVRNDRAIVSAGAPPPTRVRPPYGAHNSSVDNLIADEGYNLTFWDIDTDDWNNEPPENIFHAVLDNAFDGAVVVFHDHGEHTVEALPQVIAALKDGGYGFGVLT